MASLQSAAAGGDACAEDQLGQALVSGQLGPADKAKGFDLVKKSAEDGYQRAYVDLGLLYFNGTGTTQDYGAAMKYLLIATDGGDMKAPRYVGMLYEQGKGTSTDVNKAAQYYQRAADHNDITGQCLLGSLYERGVGVQRNFDTAEQWYMKSQQRGDDVAAPAMASLGNLYEIRSDGKRNEQTALSWYRKAVDAGIADAKNDVERLTSTHSPPAPGRNECLLHFHS